MNPISENEVLLYLLQFDVIKRYIDGGGSVLVMLGEGGESRFETNINFFLEEFGININTGTINVLKFQTLYSFSSQIKWWLSGLEVR